MSIKNYIGINRDHSGSMQSIRNAAGRDYNSMITQIRESSAQENQETFMFVNSFGIGRTGIQVEDNNVRVDSVRLLKEGEYRAEGMTPLWDSIGLMLEQLERLPDASSTDVAFLVMVITDGDDTSSKKWTARTVMEKVRALQATDRWTFVFRVPRGSRRALENLGIPEGNILEWDQTTRGVEVASTATRSAFTGYMKSRSAGATSTKSFYTTDLSNVSKAEVKAALHEVTNDVTFFTCNVKQQIRTFVEQQIGGSMVKGGAFYQLTKTEDEVQDHKIVVLRDRNTKQVFTGPEARNLIGLPYSGTVKVKPGDHAGYDIFIQSTSVNRTIHPGTEVLYWSQVGVPFKS